MNLLYFYKKYFFNLKLIFFIKSLKFLFIITSLFLDNKGHFKKHSEILILLIQ